MSGFLSSSFLLPSAGCVILASLLAWEHGQLSDLRCEKEQLRTAYEASIASLDDMKAELELRDTVIAERDKELADRERNVTALLAQLEVVKREHADAAAWADSSIPDSVRELLEGRANSSKSGEGGAAQSFNPRSAGASLFCTN